MEAWGNNNNMGRFKCVINNNFYFIMIYYSRNFILFEIVVIFHIKS